MEPFARLHGVLAGLLLFVPLSLSPAVGQDSPAFTPAWEYKALSVGANEEDATKKLNNLAAEGWELVGPLGNGLAAFRRPVLSARQVAAKKELAKWQGEWKSGNDTLIIKGDRWWWGQTGKVNPEEIKPSWIKNVEVGNKTTAADLFVEEGENKGKVCKAIFRLDGDTLQYSGSYKARPTGFEDGSGYTVEWKRVKR